MSHKVNKLSSLILKEVADILTFEVKNPDIGFITITSVEVSKDYSFAKIYVSFLDKEHIEARFEALEKSKGFIRSSLAKKIKMYKVPELIFIIDKAIEAGEKIEKILKDINN